MTQDSESELVAKITEHLLEKLKGKTIQEIERVELKPVDLNPKCIDIYDSSRTGDLVIRIRYY